MADVAGYGKLKYGVSEVIHAATNGGLDDKNYEPFLRAARILDLILDGLRTRTTT